MDKQSQAQYVWVEITYQFPNSNGRAVIETDKYVHRTLYNECNYLSMLGLKSNHISKIGPCC